MEEICFGNLILADNHKQGILKPDENGLYRINAGGFNIPNHAGIRYNFNSYIRSQMEENSDLNRRISMGMCYMEEEHPEPFNYVLGPDGKRYKSPMTSILEYINRLRSYDHDRICGIVNKIFFIFKEPGNFNAPVYNEILVKPLLEYECGRRFKENLDTPECNTAVSIRTQIERMKPGSMQRDVVYWTGYDWVKEPGMVHANKHMSAGCESLLPNMYYDGSVVTFKTKDVIEALEHGINEAANDEIALVKYGGMESLNNFTKELEVIKRNYSGSEIIRIGSELSMLDVFR